MVLQRNCNGIEQMVDIVKRILENEGNEEDKETEDLVSEPIL
jgi:hypothetical protein